MNPEKTKRGREREREKEGKTEGGGGMIDGVTGEIPYNY